MHPGYEQTNFFSPSFLLFPVAYGVLALEEVLIEPRLEEGFDLTNPAADRWDTVLLLVFPESSEPDKEGAGLPLPLYRLLVEILLWLAECECPFGLRY